MKAIEKTFQVLLRVIIICDLLRGLRQPCLGVPLPADVNSNEPNRRELLIHFNPSLNDERITQVNDLLEQLHRQAIEKRFRFAGGRDLNETKSAWDLKSVNPTPASLSETESENITVDNDTDEKPGPDSSAILTKRYLFEGDILLIPEQAKRILANLVRQPTVDEKASNPIRRRQKRTALISGDSTRWQSLPIRYNFDASLDEEDKPPIREALKYWESRTCIWFQYAPGVTDGDFLSFFKGNGCYSMIGKIGGKQGISVGDGCAQLGVVSHEVGHALGMWHEQSRPDSDRYIRLVTRNIVDGTLSNFLQRSWSETNSYSVQYDLGSVMHYGPTAFAIDSNQHTIETVLPGYQRVIGQRERPSFLDVSAVNKAYCDGRCSRTLPCRYGGYTHPTACNYCICPDGLAGTHCERPADSQNANCGGLISVDGDWTNITSPDYPKAYGKNQRCNWLLRAPPGTRVLFKFEEDFQIYCTATCYDYVEIKNETDFSKTGMRFCCKQRPTESFYSTTNEMLVIFNSQTTSAVGFKGRATQYPQPLSSGGIVPAAASTTGPTAASASTQDPTTSADTSATTTSTAVASTSTTIASASPTASTLATSADSTTTVAASSADSVFTSNPFTGTGMWSVWSTWSACSKTCGACGVKSRKRECLEGSCAGDAHQFKRCPFNICPGDTTCSKLTFLDFPCGGGGRVCSSVHEVTVKCTFPSCCAPFKPSKTQCELAFTNVGFGSFDSPDRHWEEWSEWGECFGPKCGGCARQVRHRVCQDEKCRGEDREFRPCNTQACSSCSDHSEREVIDAPCTELSATSQKEMCRRPKKNAEVTCPCCAPLREKDGQCV